MVVGKISPEQLIKTVSELDVADAEAVFLSCTNLPAVEVAERLEAIIKIPVLSSTQCLIWDTIRSIGIKDKIKGYGSIFNYDLP